MCGKSISQLYILQGYITEPRRIVMVKSLLLHGSNYINIYSIKTHLLKYS